MSTQEQINSLESRQIVLSNIMAASDAHASKCTKLGLDFGETYPQELADYTAARDEYNSNERQLSILYEQLYLEKKKEEEEHRKTSTEDKD